MHPDGLAGKLDLILENQGEHAENTRAMFQQVAADCREQADRLHEQALSMARLEGSVHEVGRRQDEMGLRLGAVEAQLVKQNRSAAGAGASTGAIAGGFLSGFFIGAKLLWEQFHKGP